MKTRTEYLLDEIEGMAFDLESPSKITPQILSAVIELKRLHALNMFFIQDTGGLQKAIDTCSSLKELGLSKDLCFRQITKSDRLSKPYPLDVAMEAIGHVYGIDFDALLDTYKARRNK